MLKKVQEIRSCGQLLEEFTEKNHVVASEKIIFTGVGDNDVYNITAPFQDEGEWVIAARVEHRQDEFAA